MPCPQIIHVVHITLHKIPRSLLLAPFRPPDPRSPSSLPSIPSVFSPSHRYPSLPSPSLLLLAPPSLPQSNLSPHILISSDKPAAA